jgi:hypothetical protein
LAVRRSNHQARSHPKICRIFFGGDNPQNVLRQSQRGLEYLSEAKWFLNTHPETIEEEPLIIELEVEDLMVVWPDGLVYPVTIAVRSHIVELSNENMKNE